MQNKFTGLIKKSDNKYVGLCLELNVASQGDTVEEAKNMFEDACVEYLSSMLIDGLSSEIKPVPIEILREFLLENVEYIKVNMHTQYTENLSFEVTANV